MLNRFDFQISVNTRVGSAFTLQCLYNLLYKELKIYIFTSKSFHAFTVVWFETETCYLVSVKCSVYVYVWAQNRLWWKWKWWGHNETWIWKTHTRPSKGRSSYRWLDINRISGEKNRVCGKCLGGGNRVQCLGSQFTWTLQSLYVYSCLHMRMKGVFLCI